MPELKKNAVAGSFIFKFPDGDLTKTPKVALFRRSSKVWTYQHKYAPIAGSIEESDANPLATAWRELQEETTLTRSSLQLFRKGKPYSFIDESVGREWTINPFGFILKPASQGGAGEAGIHIDWEHEGYDWFDPSEVNETEAFHGVPRILESLRRVWFDVDLGKDAGEELSKGLRCLQEDHESGARQLASKSLEIFVEVIRKLDRSSVDVWWRNVRFAGWHLWKNGRESMGAPILSVVLSSLAIIKGKLTSSDVISDQFIHEIDLSLKEYGRQRQVTGSKIGAAFHQYLTKHFAKAESVKIVTLSSSSTIRSCITDVLEQGDFALDVRILESRPLFEGVSMAEAIAAHPRSDKAKLTIYTDASAGIAAEDADLVIIGADLIDRAANVSNKTGSLPAVLSARHISPRARVIALAEKEKVLPFDPPGHEDNDSREVSTAWKSSAAIKEPGAGIAVRNVYFEWVPAGLIDHYVTEDGIMATDGIAAWAESVGKKAEEFFSDL